MAERDLGKDMMEQYRRPDDRVSEPLPAYGVSDSRFTPSGTSCPGHAAGDRMSTTNLDGWQMPERDPEVEQAGFTFTFPRAEAIVDTEILERV